VSLVENCHERNLEESGKQNGPLELTSGPVFLRNDSKEE
jgi:hypothetical protein